jgi:hypothetical protein
LEEIGKFIKKTTKIILLTFLSANSSMLSQSWLLNKKSEQKFQIKKKDEIVSGTLKWDLETNTWIFEYPNEIWELKGKTLKKYKKNKVKEYPASGFLSIFKTPISKWDTSLKGIKERCNEDGCAMFAFYKNNPILIEYQAEPFKLKKIESEDSNRNYYRIEFI